MRRVSTGWLREVVDVRVEIDQGAIEAVRDAMR
jgi:hypothetical protein